MNFKRLLSKEIEELENIQVMQDELVRKVRELEMETTEMSFSLLVMREIRELETIQFHQDELLTRIRNLEAEWDEMKMKVREFKGDTDVMN